MIHFQNVTKRYGANEALSDVSVTIPDGDFVFLIGPSGAGKTTMLRLLICDVLPTSGKILIGDIDIVKLPRGKVHALRRSVGMIFQDFKILQDRTVFENVAIALEILGKNPKQIQKEVEEALSLVGLKEKGNQFPAQLSAGELQRTSIARAVVMGPKILLADEPTGNLDPDNAEKVIDILNEIQKLGTTIIMATHNVELVNKYKKRTITVTGGKIMNDEKHGSYFHAKHSK
jgi:cell division transport system ATP-binding protein